MNTTKARNKIVAIVLALSVLFSLSVFAVSAEGSVVQDGMKYEVIADDANSLILVSTDPTLVYGECYIPDMIDGKKVVAIADNAFEGCLYLEYLSIPVYVTEIGANAFAGCTALAKVNFWGEFTYIGANAFTDTAWYKNYPSNFVYASSPHGFNYLIGYKEDNLEDPAKDIIIPMTVDVIGAGAFAGNEAIESVIIQERTRVIGDSAFENCVNLSSISVRSSLKGVGRNAFNNTKWLNNYAGDFVIFGTFLVKYNGKAEMAMLPNTITAIGDYAFEGCNNVVAARVPSSITNIGDEAFFVFNDNMNTKYVEIYCWADTDIDNYAKETGLTIHYLYLPGDTYGDGAVKANDARYALRIAAKLEDNVSEATVVAGDINCNGKIEPADARSILRMAAFLEDYTPRDLLLKPNTDFEILMAYAESLRYAARKQAGYKLKEYQSIDSVEVGPAWFRSFLNNPFKTQLTKEKKAKTVALAKDSQDAIDKLYECDLINNQIIKDASCIISDSHKYYYITIELNDELDVLGKTSFTSMIFPVASTQDFIDTLNKEEAIWYKAKLTDFNFDVNYTGCKLAATVDIETGRIENIDMTSGYKFNMWGKVNGIKIYLRNNSKNPIGFATRTDKALYSDFDYTPNLEEPKAES